MEHILDDKLPSTDLHESLKSGIVLRELVCGTIPVASLIHSGGFNYYDWPS